MMNEALRGKWCKILAVVGVLTVAYKSSDWYASASEHFRWQNKHYCIGSGPCWNCESSVTYWQEKGKARAGVESVCKTCNLANQWVERKGYSFSQTCWNCSTLVEYHRAWGESKKTNEPTVCEKCGVAGFAIQTSAAVDPPGGK